MSWIDDINKELEKNRESLREKGYDAKKLAYSEQQSNAAKVRGQMAKSSGQVQGLSEDKEIVQKRTESIRESRKINPLTNYDKWNEAMANRSQEWNDNISKGQQVQVIQQCDMNSKVIKEWNSYGDIEKNTKYKRTPLWKAVNGKKKRGNPNQAYGYLWFSRSK